MAADGARQARIDYLDGLRGIAILTVLGWHYVGPTFASLLPYGRDLAWIEPFAHGWVGVQLFFLISGYVIFLTLERCTGFVDFMLRRWVRLFPAMLVASLLIFPLSWAIGGAMPGGRHDAIDLLPGLSFVSPSFWHVALRRPVASLDGVFWTLYVEVAFYVVAGLLYSRLSWRGVVMALVGMWIAVLAARALVPLLPPTPLVRAIEPFEWAGVQYFGWFASGALFLKAREESSDRLFALAILVGLASAMTFTSGVPIDVASRVVLVLSVILFATAQRWTPLQRLLAMRGALFVGYVSYPLYLLHSEIGVAAIALAGSAVPVPVSRLLPIAVAAAMLALAWVVAARMEPPLSRALRRLTGLVRSPARPQPDRHAP